MLYVYLIRHKSDFLLATDEKHRLLPQNISYSSFVQFITAFESIDDNTVAPRYRFGELRLSRLNFWSKIFLRRFMYHQVHKQYGAYFARYYGPLVFIFALFSLVLSAMQVELAVNQAQETGAWTTFAHASRVFSVLTIVCAALIILFLLSVLFLLPSREIIFATTHKFFK